MELHLDLDPQEVEYLENQGIAEELSDKLTEVWNINILGLRERYKVRKKNLENSRLGGGGGV